MAITLNASDIQLTGTVSNFSDITTPFSVSSWIKYADWPLLNVRSMVGLYLPGTTAVQLGAGRTAGNMTVWTWGGGTLIDTNGVVTLSQTDFIHFVYTFNGTQHKLYTNGAIVNTTTTAQIPGVPNTIYINGYPTGGANETGVYSVEDTIYFNRELSAEEVLTLYNSRGIRDGIYLNAVARFTFGEGVVGSNVTTVKDYGQYNNTLNAAGTGSPIVFSEGTIFNDTRPYQ